MSDPASARIETIDYLRGIACSAVAWFHFTRRFDETSFVRLTGDYGYLGVDCFFVISGFVIPYFLHLAVKDYSLQNFPGFMARRIIRLEPTYLLSILLAVGLLYASNLHPAFKGEPPELSVAQLAYHLFYLIPLTEFDWIQEVYWTLAYEFAFYIVIGITFPLCFRGGRRKFYLLPCVIWLAALVGWIDAQWVVFVFGLAIYRSVTAEMPRIEVLGMLLVSALVLVHNYEAPSAVAGFLTAVTIWLAKGAQLAGLPRRLLLKLGMISYTLYLVHAPVGGRVVNLGRRYIPAEVWAEFSLSVFAFLVSVAFAYLVFRLVERPSHAFSRKIRM